MATDSKCSPGTDSGQRSTQSEADAGTEALVLDLVHGGSGADQALTRLRSEILALQPLVPPPATAGRLLAALAATQPEAITPDIARAIAAVIEQADLAGTWQPGLDAAFEMLPLLVPTPAAEGLPALIATILNGEDVHDRWTRRAAALLEDLARWRPELFDPGSVVTLAEHAPGSVRDEIFERVVGPTLLADPASLDAELLRRACALPGEALNARYLAAAIAAHTDSPADVRAAASAATENAFPLRRAWRRLSRDRGLRVCCIQNIADGQGDEIVRVVPLLQSLLDSHPETTISLITDRAYLYDHPRLETIGFDDRAQIERALERTPDVLIEFSELNVRHLNYDTDLVDAIARLRASAQPLLDVHAGKGWNDFTFDRVRLGGQEWAGALGLNRPVEGGVYAPAFRLIMELGLPLRIGQMSPPTGFVLRTQCGSAGDRAWDSIIASNQAARLVALVNPFGGASPLKGFAARKLADLRPILCSLVDQGYFVVLCLPTLWADQQISAGISELLPPHHQPYLVLEPRPQPDAQSAGAGSRGIDVTTRINLEQRTRLTFIARADLVVTVEGWMRHAAYLLGKPYRTLQLPASDAGSWSPWGESRQQRIWLFSGDSRLDRPPLPEQPRKRAWLTLLDRTNDPACYDLLVEACRSEDSEIRLAAARALGRINLPSAVDDLLTLLNDPSHRVRGAAADGLLSYHRRAPGTRKMPDAPTLEAYRLIGGTPPNWEQVVLTGDHSRPALEAALWGDDPVIRREAAMTLELINHETRMQRDPHRR